MGRDVVHNTRAPSQYHWHAAHAAHAAFTAHPSNNTVHNIAHDTTAVNYHGTEVFEVPANGQGLAALMAFRLIEEGDMAVDPAAGNHSGRNSAGYAEHMYITNAVYMVS